MSLPPPRRRLLRSAGAWLLLGLGGGAGRAFGAVPQKERGLLPAAADPLDLLRRRGDERPPRDPGFGSPADPAEPVRRPPRDLEPPRAPADRPRRDPGWRPLRRRRLPPRLPGPGPGPLSDRRR